IRDMPKKRRIELELYVYIFDRIDDDKEKEKRREDIFEFIQYLKKEKLFEYLEMGVIFIDERVLAPSYNEYSRKVEDSEKVMIKVGDKNIDMPPMELRKEMSSNLDNELRDMSDSKIIESMYNISKSNLSVFGTKRIKYFNIHYMDFTTSLGEAKLNNSDIYRKNDKVYLKKRYGFNDMEYIELTGNERYFYIN
ncbi:MAG: hypothetical protein ACQERZ_05720, partial [Fusobacteriota bacterium]